MSARHAAASRCQIICRVRASNMIFPTPDKTCACGCQKTRIGEVTSEQLDIIPAKIQVLQHVRFKYACRSCEGVDDNGPTVVNAPMPPQPIPKSNASPGLLAYIGVAKFVDGMPLYRLEPRFKRIGVEIPRNTAGWMDDQMRRVDRAADQPDGQTRCLTTTLSRWTRRRFRC